ncbi:hypothetical protein PINS_up003918 [Pythium insidiosum]|nr:hypothetical protein PINS_up003918 [Pythium insidiosum]
MKSYSKGAGRVVSWGDDSKSMGTKHSVPVTSTQYETARNADPSAASSGAASDVAIFSKPSIATVRPHEGVGSTRAVASAGSTMVTTPLDVKITNALKELKRKRMQEDKDAHDPFNRIMLKFPLVAQAFNSVRSTFEELDRGHKGYIEYADMEEAFDRLGANFSKEEMSQVFQESDLLDNGKLTFKEFLVCLAIGFVLHKIPSLESHRLSIFYAPLGDKSTTDQEKEKPKSPSQTILFGEGNKLRVAFQLAVDAFLWFDVDGNGEINREEMATRLNSSTNLHSPTKKMSHHQREKSSLQRDNSMNSEIWERRFAEMDWNHDGTIHFKEFLMAFESWVGLEDDDET